MAGNLALFFQSRFGFGHVQPVLTLTLVESEVYFFMELLLSRQGSEEELAFKGFRAGLRCTYVEKRQDASWRGDW